MLIPHYRKLAPFRDIYTSLQNCNTYHLLSDHDNEAGKSGAPHARNGEELSKACEIVGLAHNAGLNLQLAVDIVEVTGGLDLVMAETQEGLVRFFVAILFHVPSWGSVVGERISTSPRCLRG